jgi:hypothetical protein
MKQEFRIQHENGSVALIEAGSLAAAIKKSGWPFVEIVSAVAPAKRSVCELVSRTATGGYSFESVAEGVVISAWTLSQLNDVLERLGYKPVRETSNLLNPSGKKFFIDADTPSYCDPGSEAYHSM